MLNICTFVILLYQQLQHFSLLLLVYITDAILRSTTECHIIYILCLIVG